MDDNLAENSTSEKGYALLRRNLNALHEPAPPKVRVESIESLEQVVGTRDEPKDDGDDGVFWFKLVDALAKMEPEQWPKMMADNDLDALTISRLVETLEDYAEYYIELVGETRFNVVRLYASLMRRLQTAIEGERGFVRVSDYLHVMWLKERAKAGDIPRLEVSYRALGRRFGVDGKTVKAWDARAKQLNVTLDDWDVERLMQIMKPSKRAPP